MEKPGDFPQCFLPDPQVSPAWPQGGKADPCVYAEPHAGDILGDHCGFCGSGNASVKTDDEPEVQPDVQDRRDSQENQRRDGISHSAQQGSKIVIEKGGCDSAEDNKKIFSHQLPDFIGNPQKQQNLVDKQKDSQIEQEGKACSEKKRRADSFLQPVFFLFPEADGKDGAASHAQPQENRCEKCHKRKRRAHGGQGVGTEKLSHDQRVRHIIALLQKVAQNHWNRKKQHGFHYRSFCQITVHCPSSLSKRNL